MLTTRLTDNADVSSGREQWFSSSVDALARVVAAVTILSLIYVQDTVPDVSRLTERPTVIPYPI